MFTVLKERGFEYDSSIPYDVTSISSFYYPYTLDYGAYEQGWKTRQVTSPHPGLWEFALPTLVDDEWNISYLSSLIEFISEVRQESTSPAARTAFL